MTEPRPTPPNRPGGKPKINRLYIIGGLAGLAAVYWWYRKHNANTTPGNTTNLTPAGNGMFYDSNGNLVDANGNPVGGVGQSAYGVTPSLYGYTDPGTGQFISGYGPYQGATTSPLSPGTEGAWTQQVIAYFTQQGFDTNSLLSGLANWLSGPNRLSPQEYTSVETAIETYGMPPGITKVPALAQINQTTTTGTRYGTQVHQFPNKTNARGAERQYSVSNATDNEIETALRRTVADPRNAIYVPYYMGSGGNWPPKSKITMWVVVGSSSSRNISVPQFPLAPVPNA